MGMYYIKCKDSDGSIVDKAVDHLIDEGTETMPTPESGHTIYETGWHYAYYVDCVRDEGEAFKFRMI